MRSKIGKAFVLGLAIVGSASLSRAASDDGLENRVLTLDSIPMINPAGRARDAAASQPTETTTSSDGYRLQPVTVVGESKSGLREEDRVGSYGQPVWTVDRRFPGVRTYVIPANTFEFEYWLRADIPRHGGAELRHFFEFSIGLPYRLQLDLYLVARTEGSGAEKTFFDQQVELRYAFADWDKIWGNPTLYLEYANRDEKSDKLEAKLLLAGEIAPRWHWGQNILWEADLGGDREYEYGWTGGLSYTVIDQKFSVGAEAQFSLFDVHGERWTYRHEAFLGPSIQFRPSARIHADFAPLIGIGHESPAAKLLFNFAYEF